MAKSILIAPSILSADFSRLKDEIMKAEDAGADMIHIDVMDGHFVPNITVGPIIVNAVKRCTRLPLDVHLMIEAPHRYIERFAAAGSDIITIHAEGYPELRVGGLKFKAEVKGISRSVSKIENGKVMKVLRQIKSFGKKAGLSLNPGSPFCIQKVLKEIDMILIMSVHPGFGGQDFITDVLPKIREARSLYNGDIEVDGGINENNVKSVIDAGANIIVAGSYFFGAYEPREALRKLRLS